MVLGKANTYLRNFEHIQCKSKYISLVVKVNGPRDKCAMISRGPRIRCEVDPPIVVLEDAVNVLTTDIE